MTQDEWDDITTRIVELPDREGILLPADAAESNAEAMELFRRYAREVWQWQQPITNAGIDGPHRYLLFPETMPRPDEFREDAIRLIRSEGVSIMAPDFDEKVATVAAELAEMSRDAGGWRRSIFQHDDLPQALFWKLRVGYVG